MLKRLDDMAEYKIKYNTYNSKEFGGSAAGENIRHARKLKTALLSLKHVTDVKIFNPKGVEVK